MGSESPTPNDVGKLLVWLMTQFENFEATSSDTFFLLRKAELENAYISLLKRAIGLAYPSVALLLEPWRLQDFGIFSDWARPELKGMIWASTARLDDPIVKYILRKKSRNIPSRFRDQYAELMGVRELRLWLKRRSIQKELRQRWLVITGSVKFCSIEDNKSLIEFDGGLVKLSSRSGRLTWYGLESKYRKTNPLASLRRRLKALKIDGKLHSLNNRYAFLELPLQVR